MMQLARAQSRRWVLVFGLASACAHGGGIRNDASTAPGAPPPTAPPLPSPPPAAANHPALIEVRLLLVAYHGATGAPDSQQRSQAEALQRANMLAAMAKSGEHLAELVRQYSDRPGAAEDLGVVRIKPDEPGTYAGVSTAALRLAPGMVSDAITDASGYVVVERLKDPALGPERIAARHILISYRGAPKGLPGATRNEADARALAEKIATEAKGGAEWNALATQYTDEPGSKGTGGDLGRFSHGQMVPSFEAAAFALQVGETSGVVQSPFGFHVIRRYE